jgi:PHS family inorganic phosphate transporter-like MFS transporter
VVNISLVLPILEQLWATSTTEEDKSAVASSLLAGMMVGQLVGGYLGDTTLLGRVGALILVMMLQIVASLASAVVCHSYSSLIAWRFVLGVGAGGVYPLSAVLSAEQEAPSAPTSSSNQDHATVHSNVSSKSLHMVVLTFSMQGVGFVTVPIVMVSLLSVTRNLEVVWRVHLAVGCIPGVVLMIIQCWMHWRTKNPRRVRVPSSEEVHALDEGTGRRESSATESMPPSPRQSTSDLFERTQNYPIASAPSSPWSCQSICNSVEVLPLPSRSHQHHSMWQAIRQEQDLVRKLLGTACTWFLFDVLFYGNTLFQPIVIEAAFGSRRDAGDPIQILKQTAVDSLILTLIALPGYAVAGMVLGSKTLGCSQTPRYVMLQGFLAMSLLYLVIGVGWVELRRFPAVLLTLYSFTFFFANYGPNTTTFCLPSLVYSTECRTTLNGVSAAAGKLGAWTGASLFAPAADALGDATVMILCSLISVIAFFVTIFFVPRANDVDQRIA